MKKSLVLSAIMFILLFHPVVEAQVCGNGICEDGEMPEDCPMDCQLVKNQGFEENFENWKHGRSVGGEGTEEIVSEDCFGGTKCLKMQNLGSSGQYTFQIIGSLIPGESYVLSAMFKTTSNHNAYVYLQDLDWKDSQGINKPKSFTINARGNNEWQKAIDLIRIPLVDDSGESTAGHSWRVTLWGHVPPGNSDPVYYDNVKLELMMLQPFGCTNDINSKCIDFGSDDEGFSGIQYTTSAMTEKGNDGDISFRSIKPKEMLYITLPAFNVDESGFPLSPMLLEIGFKDTINDSVYTSTPSGHRTKHRAFVYSRIDFLSPDSTSDKSYYPIAYLGEYNDNKWKYMQYAFHETNFQLIRAIDSEFKIKIEMPNIGDDDGNLYLPIDYVNLRTITRHEYLDLTISQRSLRGFYEVTIPQDELPAVSYSDLTVFVRDIMNPVYRQTKPAIDEIDREIQAISALGEVEPLSFSIYSEKGIDNLEFGVSDLKNADAIISNISIFQVVYDDRRLMPYHYRSYSSVPDRLEDVSSFSIDAGTSKRIWLHVHVPENIPGGLYEGNVEIRKDGVIQKNVQIKLQVLPIKLDLSHSINPVYHDPYLKTYSTDIDKVFRLYRETGFDPFFYLKEIDMVTDTDGNIVDFDTTDFEAKLDRMIEEGFAKKKMILECYASYTWKRIYSQVFGNPFSSSDPYIYDKLSNQAFVDAFGMLIRKLIAIGNERGISIIFSVVDEPRNIDERIIADRLFTIIKDNGGNTTVTYYITCDDKISSGSYVTPNNEIPPLTNLVDYKIWTMRYQGVGYSRNYPHYGYYTTATSYLRNPVYNRLLHGLLALRTNAEVVSAYAMGDYVNNPFDDFDAHPDFRFPFTYPDFLFAYPTWNNGRLIQSMNTEGIREGIKDAKYIATLERLINQNPTMPTAIEAANYLESIKQRINPDFWDAYQGKATQYGYYNEILRDVSEHNDPEDFEAFTRIRSVVYNYILELLPPCNNGICEEGETPESCPEDCLCPDSTPHGSCSTDKPLYCKNNVLVNNCTFCGCPDDFQCKPDESCSFTCPGCDITGPEGIPDGEIDILDLEAVGTSLGDTGPGIPADITGNGLVDVYDLVMVGRAISEA